MDVPALVAVREPGRGGGRGVGRVNLDEAQQVEDPRRIATTLSVGTADLIDRLMAGEPSPTGELQRDRAQRRPDLQNAAGDTLEGGREQDLQATAELEMLGIHPMGCPLAVDRHDSGACSCIAVCSDA